MKCHMAFFFISVFHIAFPVYCVQITTISYLAGGIPGYKFLLSVSDTSSTL